MPMNARDTYTGSGITGPYSVTFPYILKSHVEVYLDGVLQTEGAGDDYTWPTDSTIEFNSTVAADVVILFRRNTSTTPLVDFIDGQVLTDDNLDVAYLQSLYISEESEDEVQGSILLDVDDAFDGQSKRIKSIADPVNAQDAATKNYGDTNWGGAAAAAAETAQSAAEAAQTAAESAQADAESAQASAEASYDSFDDRYLGAKASDPALDNDGDALITGAIYYNSTSDVMKVYNGSSWQNVPQLESGQVIDDNLSADVAAKLVKAWVNFDGTGTVAIRADYNVSSITDNGTGQYTVNFENDMDDTDYAVSLTSEDKFPVLVGAPLVGSFDINNDTWNGGSGDNAVNADATYMMVVVLR